MGLGFEVWGGGGRAGVGVLGCMAWLEALMCRVVASFGCPAYLWCQGRQTNRSVFAIGLYYD